jgi:hypothetical protein
MKPMNFESPVISKELEADIDAVVAQAEAAARTPAQKMSHAAVTLESRVRRCVQNFPFAAVFTAFAGGLLVGAALSREQSWEERFVAKPLRRRGREMTSLLAQAAKGLEKTWSRRAGEMEALGREARKMGRKMGI